MSVQLLVTTATVLCYGNWLNQLYPGLNWPQSNFLFSFLFKWPLYKHDNTPKVFCYRKYLTRPLSWPHTQLDLHVVHGFIYKDTFLCALLLTKWSLYHHMTCCREMYSIMPVFSKPQAATETDCWSIVSDVLIYKREKKMELEITLGWVCPTQETKQIKLGR